jgi:hypothetical protein
MEYFTMGKSIFVCSLLFLTLFINFNSVAFAERPLPGWHVTIYKSTKTVKLTREFNNLNGSGYCEVISNDIFYKNLATYSSADVGESVHINISFSRTQKETRDALNSAKYVLALCGNQPASNFEAYVNNKGKNANF